MDGILASIFLGFGSILGGKLGGKSEPRSTQKGIEKTMEKRGGEKSVGTRSLASLLRAAPPIQVHGEG